MTDAAALVELLNDAEGHFVERAAPVPGDLRSEWRVALLLVLLGKCHGGSATLEQLHVLNSAALFEHISATLVTLITADGTDTAADRPFIRYEPALSRAIDMAVGVGLTEWTDSSRLRLSRAGREALVRLMADSAVLEREKGLLSRIPGRVSQAALDRVLVRRH